MTDSEERTERDFSPYTSTDKDCRACGRTTWIDLGFMPAELFMVEKGEGFWARVLICSCCGESDLVEPTPEEIDDAADEYLEFLNANELIEESEYERLHR